MSKRNHPQLGQALRGSSDIHAFIYVELNITPFMLSPPLC